MSIAHCVVAIVFLLVMLLNSTTGIRTRLCTFLFFTGCCELCLENVIAAWQLAVCGSLQHDIYVVFHLALAAFAYALMEQAVLRS